MEKVISKLLGVEISKLEDCSGLNTAKEIIQQPDTWRESVKNLIKNKIDKRNYTTMFLIIVNQIVKMLLLLLLGIFCYRKKLIDQTGSKMLANLLLMIVNPMLAVLSLQVDYSPQLVHGLLLSYLAAFLTHIVGCILSTALIRTKGNPDCGIDRFSAMYSNCGFIGIPLVQSILGGEGVLYLTAYMTVFNIFSWTHRKKY